MQLIHAVIVNIINDPKRSSLGHCVVPVWV